MSADRVLFLVGALLQNRQMHSLEDRQIRETVGLAIKIVKEIEAQCLTPVATQP